LILATVAATLFHSQLSNFENVIPSHPFEKSIDERIAGVDTTFHQCDNVIVFVGFNQLASTATNASTNAEVNNAKSFFIIYNKDIKLFIIFIYEPSVLIS